ncbi:MAG TPA: hypothetical protein VKG26_01220 [Bacteroidia bacterium]|nr:hypothetical protein [Bacteroidia bacterium]
MKKKDKIKAVNQNTTSFPGYRMYPDGEDIYQQFIEEESIDPEDISKPKLVNDIHGELNEKDFRSDKSGDDLDVPGSELDDEQENIGSEDEENNYYSLGDN